MGELPMPAPARAKVVMGKAWKGPRTLTHPGKLTEAAAERRNSRTSAGGTPACAGIVRTPRAEGLVATAFARRPRAGPTIAVPTLGPRRHVGLQARTKPLAHRPPTSAARTTNRCGPPRRSVGYLACGGARPPTRSHHGTWRPARVRGGTSVA